MKNSLMELYSDRAKNAAGAQFADPTSPVVYNFDQGMPAPETFPLEDLEVYSKKVAEQEGIAACSYYGTPNDRAEMQYGYRGLREQIARWMTDRDARHTVAEDVLLANGSSHGLSLIAAAFIDPGDGVVAEVASFPYMTGYLQTAGAKIYPVPVDAHGMDVEQVERQLQQMQRDGVRPKLIYTIPTFHVPTGTLMPLERRKRLVEIAQKWNVLLVEDNCYYELWFEKAPPPTLYSLDDSGLVIQSDSFSKMLAPGVRTGWVAGVPTLISALAKVRQDLGNGQFVSRVLSNWMHDGKLKPHLQMVRPLYRRKRDLALAALRRYCEPHVRFNIPEGGIFFWLELADDMDVERVREIAMREGIACRPGEKFSTDPAGSKGFLRMSFLQVSEDEIERGIQTLGKAMRSSLLKTA